MKADEFEQSQRLLQAMNRLKASFAKLAAAGDRQQLVEVLREIEADAGDGRAIAESVAESGSGIAAEPIKAGQIIDYEDPNNVRLVDARNVPNSWRLAVAAHDASPGGPIRFLRKVTGDDVPRIRKVDPV